MTEIILSEQFAVPTKADVAKQTESIVTQVQDGEINPLRVLAVMSALEKVATDVKKKIMDQALTEHEKYGEKTTTVFGATFERCEVGVKYDYSDDEEWKMYQDNIEAIKIEQKARELILKQTGRCGKSSTTSVKVTLAK